MTMNDLTNNSHHKQPRELYRTKKNIRARLFRWKNRIRKGIHRWDIVRKIGFKMFKRLVCVYSFCLFKKKFQFFFPLCSITHNRTLYLCSMFDIYSFISIMFGCVAYIRCPMTINRLFILTRTNNVGNVFTRNIDAAVRIACKWIPNGYTMFQR